MDKIIYIKDVEVAKMIGLSRASVWKYAREGKIPRPDKFKNKSFWKSIDVERFLEKREEKKLHDFEESKSFGEAIVFLEKNLQISNSQLKIILENRNQALKELAIHENALASVTKKVSDFNRAINQLKASSISN